MYEETCFDRNRSHHLRYSWPGPIDSPHETRPNIVFILIDDLRWDELGIAGHPFLKTPNIDRIGKEGALFRNAFVAAPLCSPSRASFLTGQYPHVHGITDNVDRSAAGVACAERGPGMFAGAAVKGYDN